MTVIPDHVDATSIAIAALMVTATAPAARYFLEQRAEGLRWMRDQKYALLIDLVEYLAYAERRILALIGASNEPEAPAHLRREQLTARMTLMAPPRHYDLWCRLQCEMDVLAREGRGSISGVAALRLCKDLMSELERATFIHPWANAKP